MASFRRENAAKQTLIRLALLENGYTPLPNKDKRCFFTGWSTVQPTVEQIRDWGRQLGSMGTGVRIENGLCAIDIDIDDAEIVGRIWDRALLVAPTLRECLLRFGSGAKELWLCRVDEQFGYIHSTAHCKPDEDPAGENVKSYKMEAFGGLIERQFGFYGAHTLKDDESGFEIEYVWDNDEGPVEVPMSALPVVSKAAVMAIQEIATQELERAEWPMVRGSRGGESTQSVVYDLNDEMWFACLDGHTRDLAGLHDYAESARNPRCSASFIEGKTAINRTRCLVSINHNGLVGVMDMNTYVMHHAASAANKMLPITEKANKLGALMRAALPSINFGVDFNGEYIDAPPDFQDTLNDLIENWAWCGSRSVQCLPIHKAEAYGMTLSNLRLTFAANAYEKEGPRGGVVKVNPVDAWVKSSQRIDVEGYRFMPDKPPGVYHHTGIRAINSYRAPIHAPLPDAAAQAEYRALWGEFMEHLLPNRDEREWFQDWLAHKAQNPAVPGVAVLMCAQHFGTGRGTLFDILKGVFGPDYVANVPSANLTGQGQQGQYTDWLANVLINTTDEVLSEGEDGASMTWSRKKAYERLKERVDPRPRAFNVVRKTLPNYQDYTYASQLWATNHVNALPLPAGERRISVLTNGLATLAEMTDLKRRIDAVRKPSLDPLFISTLADMLANRDIGGFDAYEAPNFAGKELMTAANLGDLEFLVDGVLEEMPVDWAFCDTVLDRIEMTLTRQGLKDAYPRWRIQANDRMRQTWCYAGKLRLALPGYVKQGHAITRLATQAPALRLTDQDTLLADYQTMAKADASPDAKLRALRAGLSTV